MNGIGCGVLPTDEGALLPSTTDDFSCLIDDPQVYQTPFNKQKVIGSGSISTVSPSVHIFPTGMLD